MPRTNRDDQFPVHYDDGRINIHSNHCGEIFITEIKSGASMRLGVCHYPGGGLEFTSDNSVEPIVIRNMIAWRVGGSR